MIRTLLMAAAVVAWAGGLAQPALVQFYKNKTITMIVNYPAGGPTDIEGRVVALHLPDHIPGNPNVIIKNVGGAGGIIGSNQLGEASPNGSVIGFFTLDIPGQVMGNSAMKTKYSDFVLIAGVESPLVVCAVKRRRFPVGASPTRQPLQPEATGAVMEVTKWLKPSDSVSRYTVTARVCRP